MKIEKTNVDARVVLTSIEKGSKKAFQSLALCRSVDSETKYNEAAVILKQLKELDKIATAKEKSILDPLDEVRKSVKGLFKPFHTKVNEAEESVKRMMIAFIQRSDVKKVKVLQDYENGKIKKVSTVLAKQSEFSITPEVGQIRKVWQADVIDLGKLPREYMVPDMAKIKEACKAGKKVAGVEWKQVNSIAI